MTNLAADSTNSSPTIAELPPTYGRSPASRPPNPLLGYTAATLGSSTPASHDVTTLTMPLREVKDAGEIELLKKAIDGLDRRAARDDEVCKARRDRTRPSPAR